jgi:hypothetical protein
MKENHCQPYSYLDYYNGYSDTHLLANGDSLATFDYLGIDDTVAESAVHILEERVGECIHRITYQNRKIRKFTAR